MSPILRLHYSSEPNCAELNRAGPAVHNHAGLVWSSSLQLSLMTVVYTLKQIGLTCMCWPTKMCQYKRVHNNWKPEVHAPMYINQPVV